MNLELTNCRARCIELENALVAANARIADLENRLALLSDENARLNALVADLSA